MMKEEEAYWITKSFQHYFAELASHPWLVVRTCPTFLHQPNKNLWQIKARLIFLPRKEC